MNKGDMVKAISEDCDLPQKRTKEILDSFLIRIQKELSSGGAIAIPGFGTFKVSQVSARTVRNPRDGTMISVPASKRVRFVAGKTLKEAVNR